MYFHSLQPWILKSTYTIHFKDLFCRAVKWKEYWDIMETILPIRNTIWRDDKRCLYQILKGYIDKWGPWSLVGSWNEVANLLPGSDSYSTSDVHCYIMEYQCNKTRAVSYRPNSSTFLLESIVSDMQFTSISQLPIHHHHFSCSASNSLSFVARNQTVLNRRTQLDAEWFGNYPTNRNTV